MVQINQYKKICDLTDSERMRINNFFKELCQVDNIREIRVYLDGDCCICEIEGFDNPISTIIGDFRKHDMEDETNE